MAAPSQFRTLIREAVAVLAAILVAFSLDAWWDVRVEQREMHRALEAVRIELGTTLTRIEGVLANNGLMIEGDYLLRTTDPSQVAAMSLEEVQARGRFPDAQILTADRGAINAFVDGGFLNSVDDLPLRAALAGIPGAIDEVDEEQAQLWPAGLELLKSLVGAMPASELGRPLVPDTEEQWRTFIRTAAGSATFRQALAVHDQLYETYGSELVRLAEVIESILPPIDSELSTGR